MICMCVVTEREQQVTSDDSHGKHERRTTRRLPQKPDCISRRDGSPRHLFHCNVFQLLAHVVLLVDCHHWLVRRLLGWGEGGSRIYSRLMEL
jgi:hypothetical protein